MQLAWGCTMHDIIYIQNLYYRSIFLQMKKGKRTKASKQD